jgi:glycosyltransferase involved in cell wall biosynthesis
MLCASAFTAEDVNTIGAYKGKCFRWGYFTKVEDVDIEAVTASDDNLHRLMWCARFLKWKHPELPVRLADRLKRRGYRFILDMYGTGEELEETRLLAKMLNVEDVVRFCGNCPNDEILSQMRRHDVFLFTSDKNEGWGAVLNEAMSNGCAVVGSDRIGAVPFLVEDGVNGLIFTSESLESLEDKVCRLLDDPQSRKMMARNAYLTMKDVWSEQNAARQFLALVEGIKNDDISLIPESGPCSKVR